ncbi:MAG TPA: NAD(P)/FAD-dependent oxidoreductase [Candidatus Kapabacteria bacterium]|nr:NAD(P)/FAD-dependent oxidoreductase [Candidatus Kapabacteria bacterium]
MTTYDFIVIGGGRAGFSALAPVAASGERTALIDHGAIGGLCSLNGCNPKKVLVRSSEVVEELSNAHRFGVDVAGMHAEWGRVIDRKETFTGGVTEQSEQMLREMGTDLIHGAPRFIGQDRLVVGDEEYHARAFVIATGSIPRPLDFSGAEHVRSTDDILALRTVPKHLVCIGAGVVAFEFAQVFARLGSRVTILARDPALAGVEEELAAALLDYSRELGIEVVSVESVAEVRDGGGEYAVAYLSGETSAEIVADFVLNAAGRVASLEGLDLDAADVRTDAHGVVVTPYLRSVSNGAVFAAGDAHGRMQLSPVATYEGFIVARNYLEGDAEMADYRVIPRAIYTIPALASVGITEADARRQGIVPTVVSSDMKEWKVVAIAGAELARAKVLIDAESDAILGAHLLGPSSAELIHLFAMAMRFNITATQLRTMQYAYPTVASTIPSMLG